jgi:hypothetical protein
MFSARNVINRFWDLSGSFLQNNYSEKGIFADFALKMPNIRIDLKG